MAVSRPGRLEKFWSCVDKRSPNECWNWQACRDTKGYGVFLYNGKNWAAHRLACVAVGRTIPEGMGVLHSCDNPSCVNPAHLWFGTQADNVKDRVQKGRKGPSNAVHGEKHYGSKLTEEDVRFIRNNWPSSTDSELATLFGVSRQVIWHVASRRTWKHVA